MRMKRVFSLTMAATMLFSATAFGATVDGTNPADLEKSADGKFHLTYTGTTDNNEYMIWALKGRHESVSDVSFTQANVLYINQMTADGSSVTFDGFIPMKSVDGTVLITGQGMDAPVIVGYIKAEGNTISGNIGLNGRKTEDLNLGGATVTLTSTTDASVTYSAVTKDDGTFTMEGVANGTYALTVSKQYYVGYSATEFVVDEETAWEQEIVLMPGDVDESGGIGRGDLTIFRKAFTDTEAVDLKCDFDGSGGIGRGDLTLFRTSWNHSN